VAVSSGLSPSGAVTGTIVVSATGADAVSPGSSTVARPSATSSSTRYCAAMPCSCDCRASVVSTSSSVAKRTSADSPAAISPVETSATTTSSPGASGA
jgi:hypothetical protein